LTTSTSPPSTSGITLGLLESAAVAFGGATVGEIASSGFDLSGTGIERAIVTGFIALFAVLGYGAYQNA